MTFAQYGNIQASDYNGIVGNNSIPTANTLNMTFATGVGSAGYGQTPVASVSVGDTVSATEWASVVNKTSNIAIHQGTTITSVTPPTVTPLTIVAYNANMATNLQTVYANRLNASIQGSSTSNVATLGSTWSNAAVFTFTVSFANGDAARYFFNSGGQLSLTCSHPNGAGINQTFSDLASNVGTLVLSSPTSGTITISSNTFSGITKVGGGGNAPSPYLVNNGYYALTGSNVNVFTQTASTGPISYVGSSINMVVKSNGTQGSNGDTGNVITIYSVWNELPTGLAVSSGSSANLTITYPESTYISNTWGAVTLAGTASGN